jgi:hypothetical protein
MKIQSAPQLIPSFFAMAGIVEDPGHVRLEQWGQRIDLGSFADGRNRRLEVAHRNLRDRQGVIGNARVGIKPRCLLGQTNTVFEVVLGLHGVKGKRRVGFGVGGIEFDGSFGGGFRSGESLGTANETENGSFGTGTQFDSWSEPGESCW